MTHHRKICIVTGTRAEWGLLSRLARMIADDPELELQLVATNMHLSTRYGETYREIEADGFRIDWRVPIIDDDPSAVDSSHTTVLEMSRALAGLSLIHI